MGEKLTQSLFVLPLQSVFFADRGLNWSVYIVPSVFVCGIVLWDQVVLDVEFPLAKARVRSHCMTFRCSKYGRRPLGKSRRCKNLVGLDLLLRRIGFIDLVRQLFVIKIQLLPIPFLSFDPFGLVMLQCIFLPALLI